MGESSAAQAAPWETSGENVRYVPLDDLCHYRGRVAEDILSEDGALLLPGEATSRRSSSPCPA